MGRRPRLEARPAFLTKIGRKPFGSVGRYALRGVGKQQQLLTLDPDA